MEMITVIASVLKELLETNKFVAMTKPTYCYYKSFKSRIKIH